MLFHRTETIDDVIVVEEEIDMNLDDSSVHVGPGDTIVQRGFIASATR